MAAKQKPVTHEDILAAAQRMMPHDANLLSTIRSLMANMSSDGQPAANGQAKKKEKKNNQQAAKGNQQPPTPTPKKDQQAVKAKAAKQQNNAPINTPAEQKKRSRKNKRALLIQQYDLIKQLPLIKDRIRAYALTSIKVLVLVRGCPGSGKTSTAKSIVQSCGVKNLDQCLFSTDDYFAKEGKIVTLDLLDEARKWNEIRAHQAMKKQVTPVVVDDCLLKKMSFKQLYEYAVKGGYIVEIVEPDDTSSRDPSALIKRTHIPVTFDVLSQMASSYEFIISSQHLFQYFKMQYNPGQDPPQKSELVQPIVDSAKEITTPKTSKPPSPPPSGKASSNGGSDITSLKDVLRRLEILKVQSEQADTDHVLFSKQNDSTEKVRTLDNDMTAVSMSKNSILQLQNLFGGYLAPNMLDNENMISLPYGLARQLHCYVMESIEEDMFQREQSLAKGIEADLQAREDAKQGLKEKFNIPELMEENLDKFRKAMKSGTPTSQVSVKIPLKILCERFPNAHSDELTKILTNTDDCLRKVTSLTSTLPDPNNVVFKDLMEHGEVSEVDRRQAIEQALAYQKVASKLHEQKNDYSNKAMAAFKEGDRAVATFYFEIAKWHKEQIEKTNGQAAMALLKGKEQTDTLDMHFLSVKEAMQIMDLFLDANVRSLNNSGEKSVFLFIITGRGAHSNYGNAVLKHSAKKRLATRNIQYWEMNPGMLKVCVKSSCLLSCDL